MKTDVRRAEILNHAPGSVCFRVDPVEKTDERLPAASAREALGRLVDTELLAFSHDDDFSVVAAECHPLAAAVHYAFSRHLPLILSPDVVWTTLAQGFSHHVNLHAETLRKRLVSHQDKKELVVRSGALEIPADWERAVHLFAEQIDDHIAEELRGVLVNDFSTTTPTTRTASRIVLMDAFREYFDYRLVCICGIPEVRFLGTPDDWQKIRDRVEVLASFDLEPWAQKLRPICDAFVESASGEPPLDFWQDLYKPKEVYGGEVVTGWLNHLFPYLRSETTGTAVVPNPALEAPGRTMPVAEGISPESFPIGLSQAPLILETSSGKEETALLAGFLGVRQDDDGAVSPEIGWGVRAAEPWTKILQQIEQVGDVQPPFLGDRIPFFDGPKELIELCRRFNGARLFADGSNAWTIRAADEYHFVDLEPDERTGQIFADLADGRSLAYSDRIDGYQRRASSRNWWIFVGRPVGKREESYRFEDARLIAVGLPELFERAFAEDGRYWFDDAGFEMEGIDDLDYVLRKARREISASILERDLD